jgi:soluble lytic murein transglycosylase
MTPMFWARIILGRWHRPVLRALHLPRIAALLLCTMAGHAASLEGIAAAYRKTPNAKTHAELLAFANAHRGTRDAGLALLTLGAGEVDQKQDAAAVQHLTEAMKLAPQLADYAASFRAEAEWELKQTAQAEADSKLVWERTPPSPLRPHATLIAVRAALQTAQPDRALQIINEHEKELNRQQVELARAQTYDAMGRTAEAIEHYDHVWFEFPLSWEAQQSEAPLERLRGRGGAAAPAAELILTRAAKLSAAGQYGRAQRDLEAYLPQMSGADQQRAQVRLGALRYEQRKFKEACDQLRGLQASDGAADAERLYYVALAASHIDRWDYLQDALQRLERWYTKSRWRAQALAAAANRYVYSNQTSSAVPLYKACYEQFPDERQAPDCQWKYAWRRYLQDRAGAKPLFEEHLKRWPESDKAAAALYFLGRIAEAGQEPGVARVYYEAIERDFPNHYYETVARTRLQDAVLAHAAPSADAVEFVHALKLRPQEIARNMEPESAAKARLERASLLDAAGLDDLAQNELKFAANTEGQPEVMALALADLALKDQSPAQGIRFIKHYVPDYLYLPISPATQRLWRLAFPLPYWDALQRSAQAQRLDPYLFAALVRQESEFDTHVVSGANAYGLSQVLPSTARMLSRRVRVGRFSPQMLFQPEINLKIGTYYLRTLLDSVGGRWDAALASYNAGRSRAVDWLQRAQYQEPAEYVENIPITETRNYVQSIFRNADIYRRLYGGAAAVSRN